jgi:outer membrane immunogenic protein
MPTATRSIALIAALTIAVMTSLTTIATAADLFGYKYASPDDRRPLDGSYRYGPMTWTGLYGGGHVGWGTGGSDLTGLYTSSIDMSGLSGGLHAGYNFQFQSIVTGLEADIDWTSTEGDDIVGQRSFAASANWLSSFRLRLGYTFNNVLLYGTGGVAFAGYDLDSAGPDGGATLNQTLTGYAAGIGAEYAFTKSLIGRVEGLHYGLGDDAFSTIGGGGNVDLNVTSVRAGLTLKLN